MEEHLTPQEVAACLRVKASTARRWIYIGALEAETVQEGRRNRHRIKKAVIEAIERLGFSTDLSRLHAVLTLVLHR
jgi:excisionase family DNA binding protein